MHSVLPKNLVYERSESSRYPPTEEPVANVLSDVLEWSPFDRRVHPTGIQSPFDGNVRREIVTAAERSERRLSVEVDQPISIDRRTKLGQSGSR